jgi:predicted DNA-binding WGR domain protein
MSNDPTVVEEVTLNWTDLTGKKTGATSLGSNKFYKAQILDLGGGAYRVVFTYGRVGQAGQTQAVSAGSLAAAQAVMNKKVKEKTDKGYTKLDMRSQAEEKSKAAAKGVTVEEPAKQKTVRTKTFHPEVENLVKLLYGSTGAAVAAGLSSSAGATKDAPLGNLSDTQLDKGADILEKAENLLKSTKKTTKADFVDLTNEYLSNIPRNIDYARKKGKLDLDAILLNAQDRIDTQRKFITLLRDAYLQKDVFAKAAEYDDPMEVWYDGLKCDIEHVPTDADFYKFVKKIFDTGQSPKNSNFHGQVKMLRLWTCVQQGAKQPFEDYAATVVNKPGATGRTWAWHGTRTENLMGICKTGLRMPANLPKGVHITGKTFGLGIYHTPCWEDSGKDRKDAKGKTYQRHNGALKSMNYTSLRGAYYGDNNTADRGYMFLEELALGVPEIQHDVCWNKPAPDPGCDYIFAESWGHKSLANDEVVTFHESASRRVAIIEVAYK